MRTISRTTRGVMFNRPSRDGRRPASERRSTGFTTSMRAVTAGTE